MQRLRNIVTQHPEIDDVDLARVLVPIVFSPTGTSTGGYPFLGEKSYELLRDTIPHILHMGQKVVDALTHLRKIVDGLESDTASDQDRGHFDRACKVVRTVVNTAAVTAPADLWLLRQVLGTLKSIGLLDRLADGETLPVDPSEPLRTAAGTLIVTEELIIDLNFLLARGYIEQVGTRALRIADNPQARTIFKDVLPLAAGAPNDLATRWGAFFRGEIISPDERSTLWNAAGDPTARTHTEQTTWFATLDEIQLGFQMLPIILGLRVAEINFRFAGGESISASELRPDDPLLATRALEVLEVAGSLKQLPDDRFCATSVGQRVFARGPGPFGIIEAYHGYMQQLAQILVEGRGKAWVQRGANIAASQDANKKTFETANSALDRFRDEYGFALKIFIEHAVGRGEATRQRCALSGEAEIHYFGADLEDAAIDAAREEQAQGKLPAGMKFIRNADIARPEAVVDRLRLEGLSTHGAVMLVGNGFHEARNQKDEAMVEVFSGYHEAGIILLFTEESALSVDDLLSTAWNTYHAGFKYVHERSGQGLRPARKVPSSRLGRPLPASWNECATRAGYVRAEALCSRTRTIFPYRPRNDHNPAISVNHFFVPRTIAEELGIPVEEHA